MNNSTIVILSILWILAILTPFVLLTIGKIQEYKDKNTPSYDKGSYTNIYYKLFRWLWIPSVVVAIIISIIIVNKTE